MAVHILKNNVFILETKNTHYVFGIDERGYNRHVHWGKKCRCEDYEMVIKGDENSNHSFLDWYKQELTVFGSTVYRDCSVKMNFGDGCRELDLEYNGYKNSENQLTLMFKDKYYPVEICLNYCIYDDFDIIKRFTTIKNTGSEAVSCERLFSAEFSLPSVKPYTFRNTNGAWGAEFTECTTELTGGYAVWESRKGASNHTASPYFIASQNADEKSGSVYFASLAYSGNFKVSASRDLFGITRIHMGMNDFDFSHTIKAGESFETPVVYCGLTDGFGDMSRQMNRFAVENILPKQFNKEPLPVLYNSWEATGFNVTVDGQTRLAEIAAALGVELFVMDDGWFGQRKNDRAGLGDWYVNKKKFPNGLGELIDNVNKLGMDFGLWVEPEMVNPDSDLYRKHPEWAYHFDTRRASEMRHQLVLNMTMPEVQDYVFKMIDDLLCEFNIKYIKWDMNRPFSEVGAENLDDPKMYSYLHTKAVYDIADKLKAKHPDVQIEACASGGGRAELGAMTHFDMVWTSDNTDAIDRMTIQKGYSLLRPIKAMRCWVTDVSSYNKPCSLDFRFNIAMQGSLSLGGNLAKYSDHDLEICKRNIALYKTIRDIVQFGDLYRLLNIEEDEVLLNQYVNDDKTKSIAFLAANGTKFFKKTMNLVFAGLDEDGLYSLTVRDKSYVKSGAYFMNVGVPLQIRGVDFNEIITINKLNKEIVNYIN